MVLFKFSVFVQLLHNTANFDRTLFVEYLFNGIKSLSLAFVMLVLFLVQTTDFS